MMIHKTVSAKINSAITMPDDTGQAAGKILQFRAAAIIR